jgi:hypothetical protein
MQFKITGILAENVEDNSADNSTDTSNTGQTQPTQSGEEFFFAPYVDATLYPFPLLTQIAKQTNNYSYVL